MHLVSSGIYDTARMYGKINIITLLHPSVTSYLFYMYYVIAIQTYMKSLWIKFSFQMETTWQNVWSFQWLDADKTSFWPDFACWLAVILNSAKYCIRLRGKSQYCSVHCALLIWKQAATIRKKITLDFVLVW